MQVIPGFAELYRHVGDGNGTRLEIIPDQKRLTTLARTHDTHDTRGLGARTVSAFVHEERRDDVRCSFDASSRRMRV